MSHWSHHNPVRVHAGPGVLRQLPQWVSPGRWLLVTTPGFTRRGLTDHVRGLLPSVQFLVHDAVSPNPELEDLDQSTGRFRQEALTGVLAVGGGSVLDAAKVLAVTLPSGLRDPLDQVLRQGRRHEWEKKLPLVAIPTTSGTGAEVTPFATVWGRSERKKYSVAGDRLFPDVAVLDPELTLSLPGKETLYPGLDAVSHALESLWNINRTPISAAFAIQALQLAVEALPAVLSDPAALGARSDMQSASLLAGLAISQTRTALAHSISYPLTSHYGVPHGLACSFTLPRLIGHYLAEFPHCPEKGLLLRVESMLRKLDLDAHLGAYASRKEIDAVKGEMYTPDRAGNFVARVADDTLEKVIFPDASTPPRKH